MRKLISTGSPFEKTAGYSRAVVQGDWCFVSGTTGYDYATMTMPDMATSLLVGGGTEKTASGAFYASGCVPHDCGGNDGFMAVDPAKHKLYFARRGDDGAPAAWPPLKDWPDDIKKALDDAQASGN